MIQVPIERFRSLKYGLSGEEYKIEQVNDKFHIIVESMEPMLRKLIDDGALLKLFDIIYYSTEPRNRQSETVDQLFTRVSNMVDYNKFIGRLEKLTTSKIRSKTEFWNAVSKYQYLSIDFMRDYKDSLNWYYISETQLISDEFLSEFSDKVDWFRVSRRPLTENTITKFKDFLNWDYISLYQQYSEEFAEEHQDKLNFRRCLIKNNFSEEFILRWAHKIGWKNISEYGRLSDDFIIEHRDKFDWIVILCERNLSARVMRECFGCYRIDSRLYKWKIDLDDNYVIEFMDHLDLNKVIEHNKLSEHVLESIIGKLGRDNIKWYNIFTKQKLSYDFISKYIEHVDMKILFKYQTMPKELILDNLNKETYYTIIEYQDLSYVTILKIVNFMFENYEYNNMIDYIIGYQQLPEHVLEDYITHDCTNIFYVIDSQKLSEDFLHKHWSVFEQYSNIISRKLNISEDFILEHNMNSLNHDYYKKNRSVSKDLILATMERDLDLILTFADKAEEMFEIYII